MSRLAFTASKPLRIACLLFLIAGAAVACDGASGPWSDGGEWNYVCDAPRALGETCGTSDGCATGLYCTEAHTGKIGTCQSRLALGAPCMASEDCQVGGVCKTIPQDGTCYLLVCDAAGVCQQGAASGSTCNPPTTDCPADQLCALAGAGLGECVPTPVVGDACDELRGVYPCGPELGCQRLTIMCVEPPGVGEFCASFNPQPCAPGLVCRGEGECGNPVPLGGRCEYSGMCALGSYCDLGDLVCRANRRIGQSCVDGNECGEAPLTVHSGADCVGGRCVDTSVAGGKCWPGANNQCSLPMTCVPKAD